MVDAINSIAEVIANFGMSILFFNVLFFVESQKAEFLVVFIVLSSAFFMFWLKFPNIRYLASSIKILFGKAYGVEKFKNSITSQRAFWSSIAGCIGIGSIAGMCAAVYIGGPGTVFWMVVCGFIAMPLRYTEVFFGHKLRSINGDVVTECGPFAYTRYTLKSLNWKAGWIKLFAFLFILAGFGAVSVQINPMVNVIVGSDYSLSLKYAVSIAMCIGVLYIIVGGLKRIAVYASNIGVQMCIIYIVVVIAILVFHRHNIPHAVSIIMQEAFNTKSMYGGLITIIFFAARRVIVATEVGFGTTSLLHGRSDRTSSQDEAKLGMIAPFFGSVVFCSLNGLMLVASGVYTSGNGTIEMMRLAFVSLHPAMNYLLMVMVFLFGFSTIITWFYYANSALKEITHNKAAVKIMPYFYCFTMFVSALMTFSTLLTLIDIGTMLVTIPNILALFYLTYRYKKNGDLKKL